MGESKEGMGQVIKIDVARIQDHLGKVVRSTVEKTLNGLLADRVCGAAHYEGSEGRLADSILKCNAVAVDEYFGQGQASEPLSWSAVQGVFGRLQLLGRDGAGAWAGARGGVGRGGG
jgi:hypothetical protein